MVRLNLIAVAIVAALVARSSDAAVLVGGVNNRIDFNNWEVVLEEGSNPAVIEIGDIYHGVLQAQNLGNGESGPTIKTLLSPVQESLTGIFEIEVVGFSSTGEAIFGPSSSGWAASMGLPAGTIMAIYEETGATAQDFDPDQATLGDVEGDIIDGTLIGAFGFTGPASNAANGFFVSSPIGGPLGPQLPIGSPQFFYGLHLLGGTLLGSVNAQVNPYVNDDPVFGPLLVPAQFAGSGIPFDLVGRGQNSRQNTGPFVIFSQDPALIDVIVPEPSGFVTWSLLGCAGMCLSVVTSRRRSSGVR